MMAVCGKMRMPRGCPKRARTANQSASPPISAASPKALTRPPRNGLIPLRWRVRPATASASAITSHAVAQFPMRFCPDIASSAGPLGDAFDGPPGRLADDRFGVIQGAAQGRQRGGIAAVAKDQGGVAQQTTPPGPHQRSSAKAVPKLFLRQTKEHERVQCDEVVARPQGGLGPRRRLAVPRTDVLADVAAEEPVADPLPKLGRDGTFQLDGEVTDAAAGIELVGAGES